MQKTVKRIKNAVRVLGIKGFLGLCFININIFFLKKIDEKSYAQLFEDYFLNKFIGFKKEGFYVDVGANDPTFLNNTKLFYLKGWSGINIEPNEKKYQLFLKDRTRDINVNMGIAEQNGFLDFYDFKWDAISTFSKEESEKRLRSGNKLIEVKKIEVDTLEHILDKYLPRGKKIDFFSIDTEGFDIIALQSNNWDKYRPKFVCIEVIEFNSTEINQDFRIKEFLNSINYKEIFFNGLNSIYKDNLKS